MPKATVNIEAVRKPLETAPPDGFVELKRMTYGQWLHRQDIALDMQMTQQGKKEQLDIGVANRRVTEYEFAQCIVDHNLTNDAGEPLNFKQGYTVDILDPRIGNEIATYIAEMHEFLNESNQGNSATGSESQS